MTGPGERLGSIDYEDFLPWATPIITGRRRRDEWDAISLNYTSGTTGDPKGVVYHHRGAYLTALGNVLTGDMGRHPVYLWTLPMFHCNGWCFPWSISVNAGTHVCLRQVRAGQIYELMAEHGVTHLCGAPIVMSTLAQRERIGKEAAEASRALLYRRRAAAAGGARRHEGRRIRSHASLWTDRNLWPRRRQRMAGRLGFARRRRAGADEGASRRALSRPRKSRRDRPRHHAAACRATARRWARSCFAATSS